MTLPVFSQSPTDPEFVQDPYPVYDEMRRLGPAFVWKEYGYPCFPGHKLVNAILRDRRFGRDFSHVMTREEAGLAPIPKHLEPFYEFESRSILELEPPAHTRLRKLVNRAFVSRQIERLKPEINVLANRLIDEFQDVTEIDLLPAYAEKIPVIVIANMLGVPVDMSDQLLAWSHDMVAMYQFNRSGETEDAALKATAEFSRFMGEYVELRRSDPGDDLITTLIEAEEDGERLTRDELITTCILLLNAGHEATVHGIGNSIKALLENGEALTTIRQEEKTLTGADADELLRFDAPLHLFTRYVLEDLEIEGVQLSRGQTIGLLLGAANRDPATYADPDRLDFTRGGKNHVAFGAGIHFCVGAPLARLEMEIALNVLFDRLPNMEMKKRPEYADRFHFHGLESLIIQPGRLAAG